MYLFTCTMEETLTIVERLALSFVKQHKSSCSPKVDIIKHFYSAILRALLI